VSAGTLLAALGFGAAAVTSGALFYMLSATVAVSALFLLVELIERVGESTRAHLPDVDFAPGEDTNLDDEEAPLVGRAFPISVALLGVAFTAAALLIAGLPPLSGFLAKFSLLQAVLRTDLGPNARDGSHVSLAGWVFFGLLLLSGLAATVSLARAGIRHFWTAGRVAPHIKPVEAAAVLCLVFSCVLLTAFAEPAMRYTTATAASLHAPRAYIASVLSARARLGPTQSKLDRERAP
jgi:multicomponent K+:H+ antiporter subunit D